MKNGSVVTLSTTVERQVKLGCWGYVPGLDIVGTRMAINPDVQVPHFRDLPSGEFIPLVTVDSVPAGFAEPFTDDNNADDLASYGVKIAPSNENIIHFSWRARMWRAVITAGVPVCTLLPLPSKVMRGNSGEGRFWNNKIDSPSTDANSFILGTMGDGVYITTNSNLGASATFIAVTGVVAGASVGGAVAPHLVAWDKGNANFLYYFREGTGAFRSSTGPLAGAFAAIGGTGPTSCQHMEVLPDGRLAIADRSTNRIWFLTRGTGSAWTYKQLPGANLVSFAFDPSNLLKICANLGDGPFTRSIDGGDTWLEPFNGVNLVQHRSDIPYLAGNFNGGTGGAKIQYDSTGTLWLGTGVGLARSTPPDTFVPWHWYADTKGVEMLGTRKILSIPGNARPIFCTYDKGLGRPVDTDRYTYEPVFLPPAIAADNDPKPVNTSFNVDHCYDADYATGDLDYVVAAMAYNHQMHGRSKDGGETWDRWPTAFQQGALAGGSICSTGNGKAIYVPTNLKPEFTLNDGLTWQYVNLPGAGSTGSVNFNANIFFGRFNIAADHEVAGRAILVTPSNHILGMNVYETSDHGVGWVQKKAGKIDPDGDPGQYYHHIIDYVPGRAGELLSTSGRGSNSSLMYSQDRGASWAKIRPTEFSYVELFAFGATLPGSASPTVFIYGRVNGVRGLYFSADWFATTPILVTKFPGHRVDQLQAIEGDKNIPFLCFTAGTGGGAWRISMSDKANA